MGTPIDSAPPPWIYFYYITLLFILLLFIYLLLYYIFILLSSYYINVLIIIIIIFYYTCNKLRKARQRFSFTPAAGLPKTASRTRLVCLKGTIEGFMDAYRLSLILELEMPLRSGFVTILEIGFENLKPTFKKREVVT